MNRESAKRILALLDAALLCLFSEAAGAEIMDVGTDDSAQAALDRARPGDVVRLASGVHRERIIFRNSGVHGKPVVLEGAQGAILDGSENVALDWQPAPDVAEGAYRARVPFQVFTLTADGRIVTMLREDRVKPGTTEKDDQGNVWDWQKVFKVGVGPSKWDGVKALALYLNKPKELLVRFRGDLDPRKMAITVAPREAVVKISGANRCVVRGLTLRNAAYGVFIQDSIGSVVENCVAGPVDHGVWLDTLSDRCAIRFNELFMNPYSGSDPKEAGSWDTWTAHKRGGHHDRFGVQIHKTAGGHEIHDNYIHDAWDGIEDRGGAGENRGLRIHHNRLFKAMDDGLEPNGAEEDCHWNDNVVEGTRCGFRIKAPTVGPLYAYRNIFFSNGEDFRNYGEKELKPAAVFVYHNTCTARPAIMSNKIFGIGTPNYRYFNNLFWCAYWWGNTGQSVPPNWKGDYNVYARREQDKRWNQTRALADERKLDEHSLWIDGDPGIADFQNRDASLKADSPARGRGADLAKVLAKVLPGCEEGYFKGTSPDAGALQFGESMPRLPRDPKTVNAPAAGTWPGPEAEIERARLDALIPVLVNGGFEEGLAGWGKADPAVCQIKAGEADDGEKYVSINVAGRRAELAQKLTSLAQGRPYALTFSSRGSTFADARVIVRNPSDSRYLGNIPPARDAQWKAQTLRFTAPGPQVSLEISMRSDGSCDLDDFTLTKER